MRFITCLLLLNTICIAAQNQVTISGTLYDAQNGEHLVGAAVYDNITNRGVVSNNYGFYCLSFKKQKVSLCFSSLGYKTEMLSVSLRNDTVINIGLKPVTTELGEVIVSGRTPNHINPGAISLKTSQIKTAPVLMGEADLLKTIQLLPGIKSGTEGTSGIYVRGGSPDQNLIILDGVPVYNTSHAFGFFSVFNTDAISGFSFFKGGIPARYSGRLSSVLDIKMKEGNNRKLEAKASLGLISSNFYIDGPLKGGKTTFFISGRRTFIDIMMKPFRNMEKESLPAYYFYDINSKINHAFNDRNRIYLSLYGGMDHSETILHGDSSDGEKSYKYNDGFGWGNITSSLRWNKIINNKTFTNLTLYYSRYNFSIFRKGNEVNRLTNTASTDYYNYFSGINDLGARYDIELFTAASSSIKTGINFTNHQFNPGITLVKNNGADLNNTIDTVLGRKYHVNEASFYAEDEFRIGNILNASIGLNFSAFFVDQKTYTSLQPRIALSVPITSNVNIKTSYGIMSQFLHLLTNSTAGLPTDLWLPVTKRIKPEGAWQFSTGMEIDMQNSYTITVEGYYKEIKNLIEYKEGASFYKIRGSWEDLVETGNGRSRGIELLVQKETGKTTGWIGMTISKSDRQFDNINNGKEYPFRYDRRFDVSVMLIQKFSEKVSASCSWVFGTGNRITLPLEKIKTFIDPGGTGNYMTSVKNIISRNNYQAPPYHRLDVSIEFDKKKRIWTRSWSLGVYNVYNRRNPFFIYADLDDNPPAFKQFSLFPIIPYFKYSVYL